MNPSHHRRIVSTYQHVDALLRRAEASLAGGESGAPFGPVLMDAQAWQCALLQEQAARLRGLMAAVLDRFGIPVPPTGVGASWAASVLVMEAQIDLEELGGNSLNGYGPVPPQEARELALAHAELRSVLEALRARLLVQPAGSHEDPP
jgi:hypothetical protein